jgi:hypothetical protein
MKQKDVNLYTYSILIFVLLVGAGIVAYSYTQETTSFQEKKVTPATITQREHLVPEQPSVVQDTSSTTPIHELSDIWSDFRDHFENRRFHYTFEHSSTTEIDAPIGKGADFSSDIGSQITMIKKDCSYTSPNPSIVFRNCTPLFNVTRLYLDEKSIQVGIDAVIQYFTSENPDDAKTWAKEYRERTNKEYSYIRPYRDMSKQDFISVLKQQPMFDQSKTQEITIDSIPAIEFTWVQNATNTDIEPRLVLGYSFVSALGVHKVVFFEGPTGEKYYIHYKPDDKESVQMFETFHFVK